MLQKIRHFKMFAGSIFLYHSDAFVIYINVHLYVLWITLYKLYVCIESCGSIFLLFCKPVGIKT